MARKKGQQIAVGFEVQGLRDAFKAFNTLDDETQKQVRAAVLSIAELMASQIRSAARSFPDRRYQILAESVKVKKDRVPIVIVGGRQTPRASGGAGPNQLLFGMEFGAESERNAWRFPPRSPVLNAGNEGYWIFPTARRQQPEVLTLWADALEAGLATFSAQGTSRRDGDAVTGISFDQ